MEYKAYETRSENEPIHVMTQRRYCPFVTFWTWCSWSRSKIFHNLEAHDRKCWQFGAEHVQTNVIVISLRGNNIRIEATYSFNSRLLNAPEPSAWLVLWSKRRS